MTQYFKVTNKTENHHGFQYKDGLNVDTLPFQPSGSCVPGGLYFSDLRNIGKFYNYGVWLRVVTLPKDNPDFKMVRDDSGCVKWRANMIILGNRYALGSVETYDTFGIDMVHFEDASRWGYVDILQWWKDHGVEWSGNSLSEASKNGHLHVLEWLKKSGLTLKYDESCIESATEMGRIDVLNWWVASGLKLKYKKPMEVLWLRQSLCLSCSNQIKECHKVAQWWKDSGMVRLTTEQMYLKAVLETAPPE